MSEVAGGGQGSQGFRCTALRRTLHEKVRHRKPTEYLIEKDDIWGIVKLFSELEAFHKTLSLVLNSKSRVLSI